MPMNPDSKVQKNPNVVARALAEQEGGVLLHLDTGAYHGTNPVGLVIWELLDEERTVASLVDGVRARVADAPAQLEQDVVTFLEQARARDLVTVAD